jgi:hypothetical protein
MAIRAMTWRQHGGKKNFKTTPLGTAALRTTATYVA